MRRPPAAGVLALVFAPLSSWACDGSDNLGAESTVEAEPPEEAAAPAPPPAPPPPRTLPSGVVVETRAAGSGPAAGAGDRVRVHLEGRVADGEEVFTSTRDAGVPLAFTLGRGTMIPGLERGLVGARAGDELVLRVPAEEGYGDDGMGSVPPGAELVFDVRVLEVE